MVFSIFSAACCSKERTDQQLKDFICEAIVDCPGGVDTNFLNDNLIQDANRVHDFATFTHVWNNVGSIDSNAIGHHNFVTSVGADAAVVSTNTSFKAQLSSTNSTALSRVFAQPLLSQMDLNDGLGNLAAFSVGIGASGQPQLFAYTQGVDEATVSVGWVLKLQAATGEVEFEAETGGAAQNLFETIAVAGQTSVVADSITDTLTLVAGTNITITTDAATDSITINSTATASLCDADLDTCFINELTPDEDWIRFSVGIADVKTLAGFINDTSVAYGVAAGANITLKTLESVLIGKNAGTDLVDTSTQNIMVGSDAGLLHTIAHQNIYIGKNAGSLALSADEGTFGHYLNICIGEFAGAEQSENAGGNIWIGQNSGRGAGNFTPGGEGPTDCIGIGKEVLQNLISFGSNIAIGVSAATLLQFGKENIIIGHFAGTSLVGIATTAECDSLTYVGDGAGTAATHDVNSCLFGWNAGGYLDGDGNVAMGWSALKGALSPIPNPTNATVIGAAAGTSMGGDDNVAVGHLAADRHTSLGTGNNTLNDCLFLGSNTWYDKIDLAKGTAIGPGVAVKFDSTMIIGYSQDKAAILPAEQYKIGVGTDNPQTDFHVVATANGGIRYQTGLEGLGKIIASSDAFGTMDWIDPPAGGADQNLFETIAVSGQSSVVADSTTDTLTLVAGTGITITTDAATDSITINATGSVSLCDADLDTCFINELTADEDWIRFSIGIVNVKTLAGFINDTSVAYGTLAGANITLKSLDSVLIGHHAGTDLIDTSAENTFVGANVGLLHTIAKRNIYIGEQAGSLALSADEGAFGHTLNIAIGEFAGAGQSEDATENIWIGINAGRGAGDFTPGGTGPSNCIGIGGNALRKITDASRVIAFGDSSATLLEFGTENVIIGHFAGDVLAGIETTAECSFLTYVGDGAGGVATHDVNSCLFGWNAGSYVDGTGNVVMGWSALSGDATPIPLVTNTVAIGTAAATAIGGGSNVVIGHLAADRSTTLGTGNNAVTGSVFLGQGTWYTKTDLDKGVAIGQGVAVKFDSTMILGYEQDIDAILPAAQLKIGVGTDNPQTDFHVVATTNGGIRYETGAEGLNKVIASSDVDGTMDWIEAEIITRATVTTTDATVTTCGTVTTAANTAYHLETRVVARETVDSDEVASYRIIGTFKNDGGVLTQIGTTTVDHSAEDTVGWDVVYDITGTDIRVRVTGAAATTINWKTWTSTMQV